MNINHLARSGFHSRRLVEQLFLKFDKKQPTEPEPEPGLLCQIPDSGPGHMTPT